MDSFQEKDRRDHFYHTNAGFKKRCIQYKIAQLYGKGIERVQPIVIGFTQLTQEKMQTTSSQLNSRNKLGTKKEI